jgi:hypothetical protein
MMFTIMVVMGGVTFGLSMFVWGTLVGRESNVDRLADEWLEGFRAGWEAAEQFDNDVKIVWGMP